MQSPTDKPAPRSAPTRSVNLNPFAIAGAVCNWCSLVRLRHEDPKGYTFGKSAGPERLPTRVHRRYTGCTPDVHRMYTGKCLVHPVYLRCTSDVPPVYSARRAGKSGASVRNELEVCGFAEGLLRRGSGETSPRGADGFCQLKSLRAQPGKPPPPLSRLHTRKEGCFAFQALTPDRTAAVLAAFLVDAPPGFWARIGLL
jgi:hypothetical protein